MAGVLFYHLTRSRPEAVVAMLLERAAGQGWRVLIRTPDRAAAEALDASLWLGPEDGFLAHGLAGGPDDRFQPVLIGQPDTGVDDVASLMSLGGVAIGAEEAAAVERAWILFDGLDPGAVERARGQWRALTGAGVKAQYWSEEDGRWQKKAESGAA
jgi:DNA polymerase-3 subunit chi